MAVKMSVWTRPTIYRLLLDDVLDDFAIDPRRDATTWKMAKDAERCAKAMGDIERMRKRHGLRT